MTTQFDMWSYMWQCAFNYGQFHRAGLPEGGCPPPWALWGPQGPQEGTGSPLAQGAQEGTGSPPGGSPGQGEHGEEVRGDFWKTRFLGPRRRPVKPRKTASKQAPQPLGPISIDPG